MSLVEQAQAALQGVTEGPWRTEKSKYVSGWYIISPRNSTVVHATDWVGHSAPADYRFVAAARTLVPALIASLESWRDVATARWDLIEQLKAEKRQLKHEVDRLTRLRYCTRCGGAFPGEHDCGRKR